MKTKPKGLSSDMYILLFLLKWPDCLMDSNNIVANVALSPSELALCSSDSWLCIQSYFLKFERRVSITSADVSTVPWMGTDGIAIKLFHKSNENQASHFILEAHECKRKDVEVACTL